YSSVGDGIRDHAAQPQGLADFRRSQRTDRRRLGNAYIQLQIHKDSGLGGPVQRTSRGEWHVAVEVSNSRSLVISGPTMMPEGATGCPSYFYFVFATKIISGELSRSGERSKSPKVSSR